MVVNECSYKDLVYDFAALRFTINFTIPLESPELQTKWKIETVNCVRIRVCTKEKKITFGMCESDCMKCEMMALRCIHMESGWYHGNGLARE